MSPKSDRKTLEQLQLCQLPAEPGSYALQLWLPAARSVTVGRLGTMVLPAGEYLYFGSACGLGGLRARLSRHWRGAGLLHWHIDALRAVAGPRQAVFLVHRPDCRPFPALECRWSQAVAKQPGALVPAPGFGASDCRSGCLSHLVAFPPSAGMDLWIDLVAALARAAGTAPQALRRWEG